jgi:hypothetical protein
MYERLPEFKLVHSHRLDLGENNVLFPEVQDIIKTAIMADPQSAPNKLMRKVYEKTG